MIRKLMLAAALTLTLTACGDKEDGDDTAGDTAAEDGASADADAACDTMCTDAGFDGGDAEEYDHEVNCFCSGSGGTVDASACTDMCTDLGWSAGEAFDTNACQCS